MAYLDGVKVWSFRGVPFAARLQASQEWDEWFDTSAIVQIDPILDSSERYVDVGGVNYGALQRLIAFDTVEERDAFATWVGSVGPLVRPGNSDQALLARARKIQSGTDAYSMLDVTFERV